MKLPALLLTTLILAPVPVFAGPGHRGGKVVHYERNCYKNVEKYVPGWYDKHGRWNGGYVEHRKKRVSCWKHRRHHHYHHHRPFMKFFLDF